MVSILGQIYKKIESLDPAMSTPQMYGSKQVYSLDGEAIDYDGSSDGRSESKHGRIACNNQRLVTAKDEPTARHKAIRWTDVGDSASKTSQSISADDHDQIVTFRDHDEVSVTTSAALGKKRATVIRGREQGSKACRKSNGSHRLELLLKKQQDNAVKSVCNSIFVANILGILLANGSIKEKLRRSMRQFTLSKQTMFMEIQDLIGRPGNHLDTTESLLRITALDLAETSSLA